MHFDDGQIFRLSKVTVHTRFLANILFVCSELVGFSCSFMRFSPFFSFVFKKLVKYRIAGHMLQQVT